MGSHVYRMNPRQLIVSSAILVGGLVFSVAIWVQVLAGTREPSFYEMTVSVAITLLACVFTVRAFRSSICLSETAIEKRGLTGTITLPLDKIEGRRRYLDQGDDDSPNVWHLVLEPNDDRFPRLDIEEVYRFDDSFYRWFNGLPDLDELDKRKPKKSNFGLV